MKKLINKLGIDKAIAYSSAARIVQAGSNIVTIFFLAKLLKPRKNKGFTIHLVVWLLYKYSLNWD